MLARFQSLLGLAQTGPVLVVTPVLGHVISSLGMSTALMCIAVTLLITWFAARQAETHLDHTTDARLNGATQDENCIDAVV